MVWYLAVTLFRNASISLGKHQVLLIAKQKVVTFNVFILDGFFSRDIKTARGKFKRAVLQFTPESWIKVDWYNNCALRRTMAIYGFVMVWLVCFIFP